MMGIRLGTTTTSSTGSKFVCRHLQRRGGRGSVVVPMVVVRRRCGRRMRSSIRRIADRRRITTAIWMMESIINGYHWFPNGRCRIVVVGSRGGGGNRMGRCSSGNTTTTTTTTTGSRRNGKMVLLVVVVVMIRMYVGMVRWRRHNGWGRCPMIQWREGMDIGE